MSWKRTRRASRARSSGVSPSNDSIAPAPRNLSSRYRRMTYDSEMLSPFAVVSAGTFLSGLMSAYSGDDRSEYEIHRVFTATPSSSLSRSHRRMRAALLLHFMSKKMALLERVSRACNRFAPPPLLSELLSLVVVEEEDTRSSAPSPKKAIARHSSERRCGASLGTSGGSKAVWNTKRGTSSRLSYTENTSASSFRIWGK
mmetsp:Transcript_23148/g.75470  ORF Transcript_23148/g.75470 Transcript_23148/m.75470 type:complete len:200 (-) Transcript_23148:735-1334(-)